LGEVKVQRENALPSSITDFLAVLSLYSRTLQDVGAMLRCELRIRPTPEKSSKVKRTDCVVL
jgi:hypothetical protein